MHLMHIYLPIFLRVDLLRLYDHLITSESILPDMDKING